MTKLGKQIEALLATGEIGQSLIKQWAQPVECSGIQSIGIGDNEAMLRFDPGGHHPGAASQRTTSISSSFAERSGIFILTFIIHSFEK